LGVSIGFSSDSLREQFISNPGSEKPFFLGAELQRVRYYDTATHQDELRKMVERLLDLERKAGASASDYPNLEVLADILPLFKGMASREAILGAMKLTVDKIREVEGDSPVAPCPSGSTVASWVSVLSPFVKHSSFEEECEWRKVVSRGFRPMHGQQFRVGKSTLIPFVEIMLDVQRHEAECVPREKYFINEVVIGPTPAPELTLEALRSLFDSEGHPEVVILQSRIPFRDW
jgi:hypothetical protein